LIIGILLCFSDNLLVELIEVVNIVMSASVENVDAPLHSFFYASSIDKMGSRSFKTSIFLTWRGSVYEAVLNIWRSSILIRVKNPGNISSDEEVIEIAEAVRRELIKIFSYVSPEAMVSVVVHNIVAQHRFNYCVNLENVYRYLSAVRNPWIEFKYRRGGQEKKVYLPTMLIYIYSLDGSKVTAELFPTGSVQIKGTSTMAMIHSTLSKLEEIIEDSAARVECVE